MDLLPFLYSNEEIQEAFYWYHGDIGCILYKKMKIAEECGFSRYHVCHNIKATDKSTSFTTKKMNYKFDSNYKYLI